MNTNLLGDFQICISVPLSRSATHEATRIYMSAIISNKLDIYQFITSNHASLNLGPR